MAARRRLDAELVHRGLAASRAQAQRLVTTGQVCVNGVPAAKAATLVGPADALSLSTPDPAYASRGGHKLAAALDELGLVVAGRYCLDAGAAHGGFTDVLLRRGAARVVAVDVGYGQLAWRLRQDRRVVVLERTNVRELRPAELPPPPSDLVVADLSFISLRLVLPALVAAAQPAADYLLLVKPQFEAGREAVRRGGVVRDPQVWASALHRVADAAAALALGVAAACPSSLPGPAGNVEFFLHLRHGAGGDAAALIDRAAARGERLGRRLQ